MDLYERARRDHSYRSILYTDSNIQMVLMTLPNNREIGMERHAGITQMFLVLSGKVHSLINGEHAIHNRGDLFVVPQGIEHNIWNENRPKAKLFTIYSPPAH